MERCKDISYCWGRPNTLWEVQCARCERYLELYDFRGQVFTISDLVPCDDKKCENFMERENLL